MGAAPWQGCTEHEEEDGREDEGPDPAPEAVRLCFSITHGDRLPSCYSLAVSAHTDSAQRVFNIHLASSREDYNDPPFKVPYFNIKVLRGERGSGLKQPWN